MTSLVDARNCCVSAEGVATHVLQDARRQARHDGPVLPPAKPPRPAFFGRAAELERLEEGIARGDRILTIHGAPGVGKSRLLRELARRWQATRVYGVSLDGAVGREDVLGALARATGRGPRTRDPRRVIDLLRTCFDAERGIVLADNVERAIDALAEVARDLVDATEGVTFVIASRERVVTSDEVLVPLRGLGDEDAAALLVDRMNRLGIHDVDRALARRVARALDGLPLAIELAAARARIVGLTEVLSGDPLGGSDLRRLLTGSWSALSTGAQTALAEASVFRGSFDLAAADAVLVPHVSPAARASLLAELADASLIDVGPERRFKLLGVVRAFAAERLDELGTTSAARQRHAEHHAERVAVDAPTVWAQLTLEREDLLAALALLTATDPARAARLALGLDPLLVTQGPPHLHRSVLESALASVPPDVDPRLRAELLRARGRSCGLRGRHGEAVPDYREALALATTCGDDALAGWCAALLGFSLRALGEMDEARKHGLAALEIARRVEDLRLEAMSEQSLGLMALAEGDASAAREHELRAAAAARMGQAPRLEGIAEANLCTALLALGDHAGAARASERARACFDGIGDRFHLANIASDQAEILRLRGEADGAEKHLEEALAILQEHDDASGEASARAELAVLAHARGDGDLARRRIDDASPSREGPMIVVFARVSKRSRSRSWCPTQPPPSSRRSSSPRTVGPFATKGSRSICRDEARSGASSSPSHTRGARAPATRSMSRTCVRRDGRANACTPSRARLACTWRFAGCVRLGSSVFFSRATMDTCSIPRWGCGSTRRARMLGTVS